MRDNKKKVRFKGWDKKVIRKSIKKNWKNQFSCPLNFFASRYSITFCNGLGYVWFI